MARWPHRPAPHFKQQVLCVGRRADTGPRIHRGARPFSLQSPRAQTVVPTATTIAAALAADPTIANMGPYTAGDADTEGVTTRKVPHSLARLWLLDEEGVSWQEFFGPIYLAIVTEGNEAA